MLKWEKAPIFEPPFTRDISADVLKAHISSGEMLAIPDIPSHTQATERAVQMVNKAVKHVANTQNQIGYVLNKSLARERMPKFVTKKDYKSK